MMIILPEGALKKLPFSMLRNYYGRATTMRHVAIRELLSLPEGDPRIVQLSIAYVTLDRLVEQVEAIVLARSANN